MKKLIVFIISFIFISNLSAQSLNGLFFWAGQGTSPSIYFENDTVQILFLSQQEINVKARYSFKIINDIYLVTLYSEPRIEFYLFFNDEFGYFSFISPFIDDSGIF